MLKIALIGLAGFAGTVTRYWISGWVARRFGETFPTGTLAVNLAGCFLIGFCFFLLQGRYLVDPLTRSLIFLGFLGGFTTFSSFGLQTFALLKDGEIGWAVLNLLISNLGGLGMVWLGYVSSRLLGGDGI